MRHTPERRWLPHNTARKAHVSVELEAGDRNRPIWSGCFSGENNGVPVQEGNPEQKVLQTKKGTFIKVDDSGADHDRDRGRRSR